MPHLASIQQHDSSPAPATLLLARSRAGEYPDGSSPRSPRGTGLLSSSGPATTLAGPSAVRRRRRTQPPGLRPVFPVDQDRPRPSLSLRSPPPIVSLSPCRSNFLSFEQRTYAASFSAAHGLVFGQYEPSPTSSSSPTPSPCSALAVVPPVSSTSRSSSPHLLPSPFSSLLKLPRSHTTLSLAVLCYSSRIRTFLRFPAPPRRRSRSSIRRRALHRLKPPRVSPPLSASSASSEARQPRPH